MGDDTKSKVMFEVCWKPMIEYVIETALAVWSEKIVIVVWFQKESVIDFVKNRFYWFPQIEFCVQEEQLWTWHAVICTEKNLEDFLWSIFILSWDVPLLRQNTLKDFIKHHSDWDFWASLISCDFENPSWYWRILRGENNEFMSIKEEKDALDSEKLIKEINSWIYICNNENLFETLKNIDNKNAQNEYYLTDIFWQLKENWANIWAMKIEDSLEIAWINTIDQLKNVEEEYLKRKI